MNKLLKRLCVTVLSMAVIATTIPVAALEPETEYTAEELSVSLDEEDTLSETSGAYSYSVLDDGTVSITKYTGSDSVVDIPSEIDGKTVTSIGKLAFYWCTSLTSVTIPSSVTSIGELAFFGCASLISVTIPSSVTSIERDAFAGCSGLTSVTIPSSVTSIGEGAFKCCYELTNFNIAADNQYYSSENGILYNKNKTSLICCPSASGEVTISNSVTEIGDCAFYNCYRLTSVTIPNSVTKIGEDAFFYCISLTSVTIPSSVTKIGKGAFSGCYELADFNIAADNQYFSSENGILYNKNKTSLICWPSSSGEVTIPSSVTQIGDYAFYNCVNLTSVIIPNSVTKIGDDAFYDCSGLTSVTIPCSVTEIGAYAFASCSSLTDITIFSSATSIFDVFSTIPSGTIIRSNYGSKAHEYALKWEYTFVDLHDDPSYVETTAHAWDAGTVTTEATPEQSGIITYTCTTCGATKTETVLFNGTGICKVGNQSVYCLDGVRQFTTDVLKIDGIWYNLVNGIVTPNTVAKNSAGWWAIGSDGTVRFDLTGFAANSSGTWYCKGGKVDFSANGIYKDSTTRKYGYVKGGKLQTGSEQLQKNSVGWWYIGTDGYVDFNKTGLVKNSAGYWAVQNGKINFNYNGLMKNSAGTWYCKNGKVDFSVTGLVKDNGSGKWCYVVKGKLYSGSETLANNSSGWYYVGTDGFVDFSKNALVKYNGLYWAVQKGRVIFSYIHML